MCSKVVKDNIKTSNKDCRHSVHTLAQLVTPIPNALKSRGLQQQLLLQKRARSKAFTLSYLFDLIDLDSPLLKAYWSTFYCSNTILQDGKKITSRYCNQRWCLTCNRIRTAKMINGYADPLSKLKQTYFVTLTPLNVKAKDLRATIEQMTVDIRAINKNMKKTYGLTIIGLRKYECTYNATADTYHPHFHFIIDGLDVANMLVEQWLKRVKGTSIKGQDITIGTDNSLVELCKYFTKVISKDNDYNPKALDIMFQAAKGKRTFQPMGIKKLVSEDIEEIQSQEIEFKEEQIEIWQYEKLAHDWVSSQGETLTEYTPTKEDYKTINQDYKNKQYDTSKERS